MVERMILRIDLNMSQSQISQRREPSLQLNLIGLVSKASATHSDWEHDFVLASDGELDYVNDDGGNGDDRSWYGGTDLLGRIAL